MPIIILAAGAIIVFSVVVFFLTKDMIGRVRR